MAALWDYDDGLSLAGQYAGRRLYSVPHFQHRIYRRRYTFFVFSSPFAIDTSNFTFYSMLLSLTRSKMADVDVDSFDSVSAIALTAVVGAVILLLIFLCNFVKKGFEKNEAETRGTPLTLTFKPMLYATKQMR